MIFNSLKWKNLFSYGNEYQELILEQNGTVFVRGVNKDTNTSNGSGKSSIVDVFVWVLYGKPLKNIPVDKVKNNHTSKGAHAFIDFYVGEDRYTVDRYRKHKKYGNSVRITKNGEPVEDGTNRDAQKRIDQILGLDYQSFVSSFTFTSEITFEFPTLSSDKRRQFLEQILGLQAYSEYGKVAKQKTKALRQELENIEGSLKEKRRFLAREKDDYVSYSDKHKNFDEEKARTIEDLESQIEKIDSEIKNCKPKLREDLEESRNVLSEQIKTIKESIHNHQLRISDLKSKTSDLKSQYVKLEDEKDLKINNINKETKRINKEIDKKLELMEHACPTCERDWEKSEVKELTEKYEQERKAEQEKVSELLNKIEIKYDPMIKEAKTEYESSKQELKDEQEYFVETNEGFKQKQEELKSVEKELTTLPDEDSLNTLIGQKDKLLSEIENKKKESSPYGEVVDNLKAKILVLLDEIDEVSKAKDETESSLHYAAFWDDSFNNDGLKMFIFESIIPVLNSRINYYMPILCDGKDIRLSFDKFLNMDIVKDGEDLPYGGLSKGERKRVDLAIALSLLETAQAQHGVSSNIMFFDEIFDSSLDSEGVKTVTDILHTMPFSTIFVISHRLEISSEFDNTIDVVKEGKFSTILTS